LSSASSLHLSMTASSALRPTASNAVIAYTCHLAHGLTYSCFHEKHFLCLSIPTSIFFTDSLSPSMVYLRRGRQTFAPWLLVYVLGLYFLDMACGYMCLRTTSVIRVWRAGPSVVQSDTPFHRKGVQTTTPVFPALLCIPALLPVCNVLSFQPSKRCGFLFPCVHVFFFYHDGHDERYEVCVGYRRPLVWSLHEPQRLYRSVND